MRNRVLTPEQIRQFDKDGYLILGNTLHAREDLEPLRYLLSDQASGI